jgi:hypothetical protein
MTFEGHYCGDYWNEWIVWHYCICTYLDNSYNKHVLLLLFTGTGLM